MRKKILLTLFYIIGCVYSVASSGITCCNMAPADSADMLMQADTARANGGTTENARREQGIIRRVCNYFLDANKTSNRKFDFGALPGPHYSSTVGLGLGVVATGLYSLDRSDSTLQKSNVTLYGDITTKGFLMLGLKGNNIFKKDKYRLDYRLYAYTFPTHFWGIGFDKGKRDENDTEYRRIKFDAMMRFLFKIAPRLYMGPTANFQFAQAQDIDPVGVPLFEGQDKTTRTQSLGLTLTYDSRDFILNANRGFFLQLDQTFAPRFLANSYCFSATDVTASTYTRIWKGGILATEFHSHFIYGKPAWSMMSDAGSSSRLRGYYEGRYRDKNIAELQVELRQHIVGRHGIALWGGVGEVFPDFQSMRWEKILPNAGIGYRWEFKKRVNVRVDYGFTRDGGGFIFNINEAF